MKNIRIFYPKNCHFLVVKFSVYLNRRVFVMNVAAEMCRHVSVHVIVICFFSICQKL